MVDFYLWEYDYGHNLIPITTIVVPGMSYQPPLLGFKQLLNFGAYSYPDIGGWIMFGVGIILVVLSYLEIKSSKNNVKMKNLFNILGIISLGIFFFLVHQKRSRKINFGKRPV